MKPPILVTGAHRSGTTWIGKMLAASPEVAYISEPLNVLHRPGVFGEPTRYWYTYICDENQSTFLPAFQDTLHFRYHFVDEIKSLRSFKDFGRMLRDIGIFMQGQMRGLRPLLKDPFAVFAAPWFADRLDCQVVITVRHPLAFVSSLKRLNWDFDFQDLLAQPLLMRDYLEPFHDEMEKRTEDVIERGSLLWKIVYTIVHEFRDSHPELLIVRHEDLSLQPEDSFREIYTFFDLKFSRRIQQAITKYSQGSNPGELSNRHVHSIKLDSRANLSTWQKRLTDEDVSRIRQITSEIAAEFYPGEFWL